MKALLQWPGIELPANVRMTNFYMFDLTIGQNLRKAHVKGK